MTMRRESLVLGALAVSCQLLGCGTDVGDLSGGPAAILRDASAEGSSDATQDGDAVIDEAKRMDVTTDSTGAVPGSLTKEVEAVLSAKSADCLACAKASCIAYITGCGTIAGAAAKGSAVGTPKSQLCVETLGCLVPTGCVSVSPSACYCGNARPNWVPDLADPDNNCQSDGGCISTLERSFEASGYAAVLPRFTDQSKGGGWAMLLMECLLENQCSACLPAPALDGGTDGDASPMEAADERAF